MKIKFSKEIAGLVVLLVVFIVAGMLISTPSDNGTRVVGEELESDPSIYNNRSTGSRALYEWTQKLGYRPRAETSDWHHLPENARLLISIAPDAVEGFQIFGAATGGSSDSRLTAADARGVINWLDTGRTLLLLSSQIPANLYPPHEGSGMPGSGSGNDDTSGTKSFGDVAGFTVETTQYGNQRTFAPIQVSPLVAGVDSIRLSSGSSRVERPTRDSLVLFSTVQYAHGPYVHSEPAVMEIQEGLGRIIVVADDGFASNSNLSQADNAAFLYNVIATSEPRGSYILFDEFHHTDSGPSGTDKSLWYAVGRPVQAATGQLLLALVLLVAMVSPRFGAVKILKQGEVRTSGEYLTSLADLYRRADATIPALEVLYRQFLRDLCERLAVAPNIPLDTLAEVAAKRGKISAASLRQLITTCETALDTKKLTAPDLLTLSRQMETVKRQLD
jgi:hypothetical protein